MRADELRGTHGCAVYRSTEEAREILAEFFGAGMARREAAVLLDGADDGAGLLTRLREDGRPAREWVREGTLVLVDPAATRTLVLAAADRAREAVTGALDRARAGGHAGVRIAGTVPARLRAVAGPRLAAFDRAVDATVAGEPASVLCLYDGREDAPSAAAMTALHRASVSAPAVFDDGMLRVTASGRDVRLAGETDLSHRPALRSALRGARAVDTASLRFLDVGALEALTRAVAAGAHLTRRSAAVERLLDACPPFGAPRGQRGGPG